MMPLVGEVVQLGRRSVVRTLRQPANIIAPVLFPIALLAVNSAGLAAATKIPGFPTHFYAAFADASRIECGFSSNASANAFRL